MNGYCTVSELQVFNGPAAQGEYCALRKYYLDCLKWEQVAADMNFTSRGIFALRRRAIEHRKRVNAQ